MRTYKKIGKNKYKDIQDAITSLATVIENKMNGGYDLTHNIFIAV